MYIISVIHYNPLEYTIIWGVRNVGIGKKHNHGKNQKDGPYPKIPMLKYDYKRTLQSDYGGIFRYTDALCLLSLKFLPDLWQIYSKDLSQVVPSPIQIHIPLKKTQISSRRNRCVCRPDRVAPRSVWDG